LEIAARSRVSILAADGDAMNGGASRSVSIDDAVRLAEEALRGGRRDQALEIAQKILAVRPDQPRAHAVVGAVELDRDRLGLAEVHLSQAALIAPDDADVRASLQRVRERLSALHGTPYFRGFLSGRSQFIDYPRNVAIETVGRCNAACSFCPHGELDRRFSGMDDGLFAKILDDLREIPAAVPTNIFPNLVNEPFMDRKFIDRLLAINRALPHMSLHLFTNFNVLPKDFDERFWAVRNIRAVNVSFYAANATEYEATMRIDFARTVAHIRRFMTGNRERRLVDRPLVLSRVMDHGDGDARFVDQCKALFDEFEYGVDFVAHVKNRSNWLGRTADVQSAIPYAMPCQAWFDINILCTGRVPHCCMDAVAEFSIGDVTKNSVLAIYNDPHFKNYRLSMMSREAAYPCNGCSVLQ
jgi:MoaA/NifB/PqqE/SkfB family radical SAM enzyme